MGTDAHYQSMPDGCFLFEKAKLGGHWLHILPHYYLYADGFRLSQLLTMKAAGKTRYVSNETIAFAEEAVRTEKLYPGLKDRYLNWGRQWDCVHYLLSAERRGYKCGKNDTLIGRAIWGGDSLEKQEPADQREQTVRYLSPMEIHQVVDVLSEVTEDQMREFYDYEKMHELQVYKVWQLPVGEPGFQRIYEAFIELREFYRLVASYDEGVITELS